MGVVTLQQNPQLSKNEVSQVLLSCDVCHCSGESPNPQHILDNTYLCADVDEAGNACHWTKKSVKSSGNERDPFYADQKYFVMLAAHSSLGTSQMPRFQRIRTQFLGIK